MNFSLFPGIPDFRSPDTGLYSNLEKYNLPFPEAIFDIDFFKSNPKPFFVLVKDLYPGAFNPTPSHCFIRLLHEKGLLLRHYTQVIKNRGYTSSVFPVVVFSSWPEAQESESEMGTEAMRSLQFFYFFYFSLLLFMPFFI